MKVKTSVANLAIFLIELVLSDTHLAIKISKTIIVINQAFYRLFKANI